MSTAAVAATATTKLLNKFENLKSSASSLSLTAANQSKNVESSSLLNKDSFLDSNTSSNEKNSLGKNSFLKNALNNCWGNLPTPTPNFTNMNTNFSKTQQIVNPIVSSVATSNQNVTSSPFIDAQELKRKLIESTKSLVILLDCRAYTDFNSKAIHNSVHLNCRDKLIRKRLQTCKLSIKDLISNEEIKKKLDSNEDCLIKRGIASIVNTSSHIINRLACVNNSQMINNGIKDDELVAGVKLNEESKENAAPSMQDAVNDEKEEDKQNADNMIIIYDDKTSDLNELQAESNPLKIVQENIKQCGYKKECKILKGGFNEFAEIFPEYCVNKNTEKKIPNNQYEDQHQSAIDNATMTEITPYLFLGNECDAKNVTKLEEQKIFYILNVTKNIPFYDNLLPATSSSKFNLKRIAVNDCSNQNLKEHFEEAIDFIQQAKKNNSKVLVHCQAGISRSPTLVIAYLMKEYGKSMDEAYGIVRNKRSIIAPNIIFMSQLMDFDVENLKAIKKNSFKNLIALEKDTKNEVNNKYPKCDEENFINLTKNKSKNLIKTVVVCN